MAEEGDTTQAAGGEAAGAGEAESTRGDLFATSEMATGSRQVGLEAAGNKAAELAGADTVEKRREDSGAAPSPTAAAAAAVEAVTAPRTYSDAAADAGAGEATDSVGGTATVAAAADGVVEAVQEAGARTTAYWDRYLERRLRRAQARTHIPLTRRGVTSPTRRQSGRR